MLSVVILAAGSGTRMKSSKSKVLFEVGGKPMIDYVIDVANSLDTNNIVVVVGKDAESVKNHLKDIDNITFAVQEQQLGTADAVKSSLDYIKGDDVLILCGDMPFMNKDVIKSFIDDKKSKVNVVSVINDNPTGYGRIVRDVTGNVIKIVEEKDADKYVKRITEVNTGVYLIDTKHLKSAINTIDSNNSQNEYYFTDIVDKNAYVHIADDKDEFAGINDRLQLANMSKKMWRKRADDFMLNGVSILDPDTFYADSDVEIESDVTIYPNVTLQKGTKISHDSVVMSGVRVVSSTIGTGCTIKDNSLIDSSTIGDNCSVGPMAHLRPGSVLKGDNKIGNFVELKKAIIGIGSKASHLTYLGDCELGKDVNIGCGTITCNYDGYNKHRTIIGDNVFIGSDVQLVAPVEVGSGAIVAAGTTVTNNVESDSLAMSRTKQNNIANMGKKLNERNKAKKEK